jgi:hypothetical protein
MELSFSSDLGAGEYDATPDKAIEAVQHFDGPLLIDLDETLYLRNSTEDFIDCARPALAAYMLLKLLDLLRPWRWTGAETRDVWRVRLVIVLFPWVILIWKKRVTALVREFGNVPLLRAVNARPNLPIIVTLGFRPIVTPLIAALGLPSVRVVAARVWTATDRRDGKLALAGAALGAETLQRSLCLTDSLNDLAVLKACAYPVRTIWPRARYRPAFAGLYIPGRYLTLIKRPNAQYIRRIILQKDYVLWVLSSIWLAAVPPLHLLGLLGLLISFWAVYEQGYADNDRIAARFEESPQLTAEFENVEVAIPQAAHWVWAAAAGIGGIALLRWPQPPSFIDCAIWTAVLFATWLCFRFFNRLDKATRVWPYAGLQFARCAAFATLVPIVPIAPAAIGAHVIENFVPYFVRRLRGGSWDLPHNLMYLIFLVLLSLLAAAQQGVEILLQWPTLTLLGFAVLRAARELRAVVARASWIDRGPQRDSQSLTGSGPDRSGRPAPQAEAHVTRETLVRFGGAQ